MKSLLRGGAGGGLDVSQARGLSSIPGTHIEGGFVASQAQGLSSIPGTRTGGRFVASPAQGFSSIPGTHINYWVPWNTHL